MFGLVLDMRFVTATITNKIRLFWWSSVESLEFVFRVNFLTSSFPFFLAFLFFFFRFVLLVHENEPDI